ncbi:hypothetical protein PISMIDRAFT_74358, partial [Pisolithus microcarpus 441]
QVVGGYDDGNVRRWRIEDGQQQGQAMRARGHISSIAASQDGRWIVSGDYLNPWSPSRSFYEIVWNAATHETVCSSKGQYAFSPDSSRLATLSSDSGFRVYSTHDGHVLFDSGDQGSANSTCGVTPFAWSPDGQQLFVTMKGKVTCLDVSKSSSSEWSIHDIGSYASIASNGRFIARSAGTSVSLWDCVCHKQIGSLISHTAEITSIALSPSGRYLACG